MSGFRVALALPDWMASALPPADACLRSVEERMDLVIRLAQENVRRGTGGPFAAAVFDAETHRLVAPGVNVVLSQWCSAAHAEMLAIMLAQRLQRTHDLAAPGAPPCELVASAAPCAMCLGAVPWSGVRRVVCGAREADVRAAGFDEGDKPADWQRRLARRGIVVIQDVRRAQAVAVLAEYARGGGPIYNSRIADTDTPARSAASAKKRSGVGPRRS
jgi:tRNA(Arg) A34 adenosine deaminase TadA